MNQSVQSTENLVAHAAGKPFAAVKEMVQACIQCGTCTGSCPNAFAMDYTPRRMWRMVLMDLTDQIFASRTFVLCSACYTCSLRCPRGLPLTEAMAALKQIAAKANLPQHKAGNLFYKNFLASVRRHGRIREMELMTLYFASMKNPLLPLRFTPLGMKLIRKGKVSIQLPSIGKGTLDSIFRKSEEQEAAS